MSLRSPLEQLLQEPHRFGFFQALRLLERWFAQQQGLSRTQMLARRVSFHNSVSLGFPPGEIEALQAHWSQAQAEGAAAAAPRLEGIDITPAFIGLLGRAGTLPLFYTDLMAKRDREDRHRGGRAFLDIFLHRATALFYDAWRKHRLALRFESDRRKQALPLLLALAGLGPGGLRERLHGPQGGVDDDALAYFAGALQRRPVSAATVQQVLSHYFRVPVRVEQFIGAWFELAPANRSFLGIANSAVGPAVLGGRVWQRDLRVRLTLGPLGAERFQRFLPRGAGALALRELLALLAGPTLEYEVRLEIEGADIRGTRLPGPPDGDAPGALEPPGHAPRQPPQLGWDTFLVTRRQTAPRADPGYALLTLA